MTDPIADFLTQIRNAQMARKKVISIPYSKIKFDIAKTMEKNNFLKEVQKKKVGKFFEIEVSLLDEKKINLKRKSKPGQRSYTNSKNIRKVLNGLGISILSTSQGIMTGYEARSKNIGGELLCEIS